MPTFDSAAAIFDNICMVFQAEKAQNDTATILFDLSGDNGGKYWVRVANGTCESGQGAPAGNADMTLITTAEDWMGVANGTLNPMTAFMQGKIKVQGNMGLAMKLQSWFKLGA